MNMLVEWIPGREWQLRAPGRIFIGSIHNLREGLEARDQHGRALGFAKNLEEAQAMVEQAASQTEPMQTK